MKELKYLFYDTERSGNDHMVSIGYVVTDSTGAILDEGYEIIKPYKAISRSSVAIHGITTSEARKKRDSSLQGSEPIQPCGSQL